MTTAILNGLLLSSTLNGCRVRWIEVVIRTALLQLLEVLNHGRRVRSEVTSVDPVPTRARVSQQAELLLRLTSAWRSKLNIRQEGSIVPRGDVDHILSRRPHVRILILIIVLCFIIILRRRQVIWVSWLLLRGQNFFSTNGGCLGSGCCRCRSDHLHRRVASSVASRHVLWRGRLSHVARRIGRTILRFLLVIIVIIIVVCTAQFIKV